MTDKVQKISEEVKRLKKRAEHNFDISLTENERQFWIGELSVLTLIGKYIDTIQEEPVSEKKCIFTKEEFTEEDRKILCEDCEEECECNITGISTLNARGKLKELLDNINEENIKITRKQMEKEPVSKD